MGKRVKDMTPDERAGVNARHRARYRADPEKRQRAQKQSREWYQANPERVRSAKDWKQYGITPDDYARMFAAQGGRCAICRTDTPGGGRRWAVDHDHQTGKVRGLLCGACNTGLGLLRDSSENLTAARNYVAGERSYPILPRRIYVSGTFTAQARLRAKADVLRDMGCEIVSNWLYEAAKPATLNTKEWNRFLAEKDIGQVAAADCVILDLDGESTTGGRFVEWGVACYPGFACRRYIVGGRDRARGVFDSKAHRCFDSWDELLIYFERSRSMGG